MQSAHMNYMLGQARVEDMHRAAAASGLRAQARAGDALQGHVRGARLRAIFHPSFVRRVVTRVAV